MTGHTTDSLIAHVLTGLGAGSAVAAHVHTTLVLQEVAAIVAILASSAALLMWLLKIYNYCKHYRRKK